MTDSTWDDFTQDLTIEQTETPEFEALETDVAPVLDGADGDAWTADHNESWGDFHGGIASDAVENVSSELRYADDQYAMGNETSGDAAMNRADLASQTAENEGAQAGDYYEAAESWDAQADEGYEKALDYTQDIADTTFDSPELDTSSFDTSSFDAVDASLDATTLDTVDTSFDTSSTFDAVDYSADDSAI